MVKMAAGEWGGANGPLEGMRIVVRFTEMISRYEIIQLLYILIYK